MVTTAINYMEMCLKWLPQSWINIVMGFFGLMIATAIAGVIDKAWRLIGR